MKDRPECAHYPNIPLRRQFPSCTPLDGNLGSGTYLLRSEGIELITPPSSSRTALELLRDDKVHIAGSHLRDDQTGE